MRPGQRTKKLLNMKLIIPIIISALGTAPKGFESVVEELKMKRLAEATQYFIGSFVITLTFGLMPLRKCMNPFIPRIKGLRSTITGVFYKDGFSIK